MKTYLYKLCNKVYFRILTEVTIPEKLHYEIEAIPFDIVIKLKTKEVREKG